MTANEPPLVNVIVTLAPRWLTRSVSVNALLPALTVLTSCWSAKPTQVNVKSPTTRVEKAPVGAELKSMTVLIGFSQIFPRRSWTSGRLPRYQFCPQKLARCAELVRRCTGIPLIRATTS